MRNENDMDQTGELEMIDIHQNLSRREATGEAEERRTVVKKRPPQDDVPRQRPPQQRTDAPRQRPPQQRAAAPQQRTDVPRQRPPQQRNAPAQKEEPRRKRGGGGMIVFTLIFLLTLGAAGYMIYRLYDKLNTEQEARIEVEEALENLKKEVAVPPEEIILLPAGDEDTTASEEQELAEQFYTHELVEQLLAQARAGERDEGAKEKEEQIREMIMYAATREGGGPSTAVRTLVDDYAFYTVPGGYRFQKLLDEVPRNTVDWDDLVRDEEDDSIRYMPGGTEHSWPMIDVSAFQKEIDWQAVADSGIKYAMLRAGFRGYSKGAVFEDDYIEANLQGATEAGIKVGVYFFTEAIDVEEAKEEAQLVIDRIRPYQIDLPVVIDIERITNDTARADQLDRTTRTDVSLAFLDEVEAAGYRPMIYCGLYTFFEQLDQSRIWKYPLWYPYYEPKFYFPYKVVCWQYTDKAKVPGIDGVVDMSIWLEDPMGGNW
ncbi:MAG: hypothetical protein K5697_17100 [Lachnospiraceae bacterium]|nr:hypothetical protein [Lachnospiraceae bacterium]